MAGEKQPSESISSPNPSAARIRDNQRRSRARHREYVEGLQRKVQDYERRGVDATLEMQQAARNVAVENSRLRILLGYHGVSNDEIDKFLQTFPDQSTTENTNSAINQLAAPPRPTLTMAPKMPLQPLSRPPSAGPPRSDYVVPQVSETSTREVVDAIVGIRREGRGSGSSSSGMPQRSLATVPRQTLLQPRPPSLPVMPALVVGPTRRQHNPVDKLSVLATASAQQNSSDFHAQSQAGKLHIPSIAAPGQGPSATASAAGPSRLRSVSPSLRDLSLKSLPEGVPNTAPQVTPNVYSNTDPEPARAAVRFDSQDEHRANASAPRHYDNGRNP